LPPPRRSTRSTEEEDDTSLYNVSSQALAKYQQYFYTLETDSNGIVEQERAMGMFRQSVSRIFFYSLLFVVCSLFSALNLN
jgi:hypothetical protein